MRHTWALVLAAGAGTRLELLTTTAKGQTVPKQFCTLNGGPTLLRGAVQRAESITSPERICAIVAEQHRHWWRNELAALPGENVIVQPHNRGTAIGILWPLLHILERDPDATIVLLPSDHYASDEGALAESLEHCVAEAQADDSSVVLLGMQPDDADTELGYVIPAIGTEAGALPSGQGTVGHAGSHAVSYFAEKPATLYAQQLIAGGALWNTFIVAARARAMLQLIKSRCPQVVLQMQAFRWGRETNRDDAMRIEELYERLPSLDFSRDVLVGREAHLRVVSARPCGWSDLGTPRRVSETVRRLRPFARACEGVAEHLNLAQQCERLQMVVHA